VTLVDGTADDTSQTDVDAVSDTNESCLQHSRC